MSELPTTAFRELEAAAIAAMTTAERQQYDEALLEEEQRLRAAEHAYNTRRLQG